MASAGLPYNEETQNGLRLAYVLCNITTKVCRDLFHDAHGYSRKPENLYKELKKHEFVLRKLRRRNILQQTQFDLLLPTDQKKTNSEAWDITLLTCLFRNIIFPNSQLAGDELPDENDRSEEANLIRIRYYRNNLFAHNPVIALSNNQFHTMWSAIERVMIELGPSVKPLIDEAKSMSLDPKLAQKLSTMLSRVIVIEESLDEYHREVAGIKQHMENTGKEVSDIKLGVVGMKGDMVEIKQSVQNVASHVNKSLDEHNYRISDIKQHVENTGREVTKMRCQMVNVKEDVKFVEDKMMASIAEIDKSLVERHSDIKNLEYQLENTGESLKKAQVEIIDIKQGVANVQRSVKFEEKKNIRLEGDLEEIKEDFSYISRNRFQREQLHPNRVKELSNELKKYYLTYEKNIPMVEWDDKGLFDIDKIFVNLQLRSFMSRRFVPSTSKRILMEFNASQFTDSFESVDSFESSDALEPFDLASLLEALNNPTDQPTIYNIFNTESGNKRIVIVGDPGMGKTTVCRKLAIDFAQAKPGFVSVFTDVEFVIFIRCRDLEDSLFDYIAELVLHDVSMKDSFVQYLRKNSQKVLFIVDGLDELPSGRHKDLEKLLKEKLFRKSFVLVTTRPEAFRNIEQRFAGCTEYKITGFSQNDIKTFVKKYFSPSGQKKAEKFMGHLKNHSDLMEMCTNPLSLLLLCLLWEDLNGLLPTDFTSLCCMLTDCLLDRFIHKKEITCSREVCRLHLILPLSLLAYQSQKQNKIYFDHSELLNAWQNDMEILAVRNREKLKFSIDNVIQLGLVLADRGRKRLANSFRFQFMHRSFQEFLTAWYIQYRLSNIRYDHSSSFLQEIKWLLKVDLRRPFDQRFQNVMPIDLCPLSAQFRHIRSINHLIRILDIDNFQKLFRRTLNSTKVLCDNFYVCDEIFKCLNDIQDSKLPDISEFLLQYFPRYVFDASDVPKYIYDLFRKCGSCLVRKAETPENLSQWHTSHLILKNSDEPRFEEISRIISSEACQLPVVVVIFTGKPDLK